MIPTETPLGTSIIYTDDHCRGCNKCLGGCPVFGSNVADDIDGQARMRIDPEKCVLCGNCIDRCTHNARVFEDDTARLLRDLESLREGRRKRPISVVFAPSFFLNYPEKGPQTLGWLKSLGVSATYSAAFGADIATWAYIRYIKSSGRGALISSACPSVVEAVERHYPTLCEQLIPVQSPQMCTAIYLRDQKKIETDIAFISPCIAKKSEIERPDCRSFVQHNVTFKNLMTACKDIDLTVFDGARSELEYGPGALFPVPGGLRENMLFYLGKDTPFILQAEGSELVFPILEAMAREGQSASPAIEQAGMLDLLSCQRGCTYGTATEFRQALLGHIPLQISQLRQNYHDDIPPKVRLAALEQRFAKLDVAQYMTSFRDLSKPVDMPTAEEVEDILHRLYKFTREEKTVDCAACGYSSCRQMAQAIALGYNHPGNCIQYVRARLELESAQAAAGQKRLADLEQGAEPRTAAADPLTGLDVRIDFERRLEEILAQGQGGYVLTMDLDGFTAVNETYGHNIGSQLLAAMARYLRDTFGTLCSVYRMGGDEFALLAEGLDPHMAAYMENSLLHKSREPWELGGLRIFCTSSMGLAELEPGLSTGDIMTRMSLALESAKAQGKNMCVHYTADLDRHGSAQADILNRLRDDVLGGFRGFEVFYQPWVTCDGTVVGTEALARWKDRDDRPVAPRDFIDLAEGAGLIGHIGDFVLRRAAEKCLEINGKHPSFSVSVNISANQMARPDFCAHTLAILDDVGVDKGNMILEITESLGFEDLTHQRQALLDLSAAGVQIAMDDFGSGYSPLSYIGELPLDLIKIDRSLIQGLEGERYSQYMLTTMTDLTHKMGRRVVAEGVETRAQLELCESFGVDLIQGFLFFRPMPGEQLSQLLRIT